MKAAPFGPKAGLGLNTLGLAALAVAFVLRNDVEVKGAYFNRSVGADATALSVTAISATPWLVISALLFTLGTALLLAPCLRSSR